MKRIRCVAIALIALFLLSGCDIVSGLVSQATTAAEVPAAAPSASPTAEPTPSPAPSPTADPVDAALKGHFEGNVYVNDYFGLTITIPEDWKLESTEQFDQADQIDADRVSKMSAGSATKQKRPGQTSFVSFVASKYGLNDKPGPFIMLAVEALGDLEMTPVAYCKTAIKYTDSEKAEITFGKVKEEKLAGVKFATATGAVKLGEAKFSEILHSTVRKGYGLTFIMTSYNKSNLKELNAILNTMEFN